MSELTVPSLERVRAARVLVMGDAMLDRYWFGAVDRISPEAPVPVMRVTHDEERPGGAANVALNVVTLGAKASLLATLGDDDAGRQLRAMMVESGVHALLDQVAGVRTTVKLRVIARSQHLLRLDFENAPPAATSLPSLFDRFTQALPSHDAVLFSDYGKGGLAELPQMIRHARAAGKIVLVDPKGVDYERYAGANVITPNQAELAQVVGAWVDEATLVQRAQSLRSGLGIDALLVTRSEEGMSLFDEQGHLHVPAIAREVFDVTGAGDTVIATLACMLAAGLTLAQSVTIANRAGGIVVAKFGTAALSSAELFA